MRMSFLITVCLYTIFYFNFLKINEYTINLDIIMLQSEKKFNLYWIIKNTLSYHVIFFCLGSAFLIFLNSDILFSCFIGYSIALITNIIFTILFFSNRFYKINGKNQLNTLFKSEVIKMLLTGVLFSFAFIYYKAYAFYIILGYMIALLISWLTFYVSTKTIGINYGC